MLTAFGDITGPNTTSEPEDEVVKGKASIQDASSRQSAIRSSTFDDDNDFFSTSSLSLSSSSLGGHHAKSTNFLLAYGAIPHTKYGVWKVAQISTRLTVLSLFRGGVPLLNNPVVMVFLLFPPPELLVLRAMLSINAAAAFLLLPALLFLLLLLFSVVELVPLPVPPLLLCRIRNTTTASAHANINSADPSVVTVLSFHANTGSRCENLAFDPGGFSHLANPTGAVASRNRTPALEAHAKTLCRQATALIGPSFFCKTIVFAFVICEAFFVFAKQCKTNSED